MAIIKNISAIKADDIKAALEAAISNAAMKNEDFSIRETQSRNHSSKLPLDAMLRLLLSMNGGSLNKELYSAGIEATASAFCQRRAAINPFACEALFKEFNKTADNARTYRGYRVLAVDGSTITMARNPKSLSFINDGGKGYNAFHLNPLYDVLNGTFVDAVVQPQPRMDEIGALVSMLAFSDFREKTIIVADRGYEAYNLIAHLMNTPNVDFVLRVKQGKAAMREVGKLPLTELDTDVSFEITTTQTNADKQNKRIFLQTGSKKGKINGPGTRITRWDFPSPYTMRFRVVRQLLPSGEYETIATSLPRELFSPSDIMELYHMRWGIELAFRALKYSIGLSNLHSKKDNFVRQEIWTALTMQNFVSRIVAGIVLEKTKETKYEYAVNYKMAVTLCKEFFRTPNADSEKLVKDLMRYTEPIRPGRSDERNMRVKSFAGFVYRIAA